MGEERLHAYPLNTSREGADFCFAASRKFVALKKHLLAFQSLALCIYWSAV